jgi:hypothetical protein
MTYYRLTLVTLINILVCVLLLVEAHASSKTSPVVSYICSIPYSARSSLVFDQKEDKFPDTLTLLREEDKRLSEKHKHML